MYAAPNSHPELASGVAGSHRAPLIAHIIFRFNVGGLENGLVNLINWMPAPRFRHAVISLTDCTEFRQRLRRADVPVFALNKPLGNSPITQFRLWQLLNRVRPDIVHTRNIGTLEAMLPAALAGVPVRIHGEHGRDIDDLDGTNVRRRIARLLYRPFVHQYIALSQELRGYLEDTVGVPPSQIAQIHNGVDSALFRPAGICRDPVPHPDFSEPGDFVIGTVGRMQEVKDQLTLARAFVRLMQTKDRSGQALRLVMIGDGPLRERVRELLAEAGLEQYAWLPGERSDVARLMRSFSLFVLPSLAEGISNTVLEAMATGLPVVATAVGGNSELVQPGVTGTLVPRQDPASLAQAVRAYVESPEMCRSQGAEARRVIERRFGKEAMVESYLAIYDRLLALGPGRART